MIMRAVSGIYMGGEVSEYMQTARCLRSVPASFRIVCVCVHAAGNVLRKICLATCT